MSSIDLALKDVEYAFRQLEFAVKLMCYCELGHLDVDEFDTDVTILLDKENVEFLQGNFKTPASVVIASQMNVRVAFGVSAVALDSAFEAAGVPTRLKSREYRDELRTFVYMVRCAFAHKFADPRWQTNGPDFARSFSLLLDSTVVSIDLSSLHEREFEYSQIGGLAQWFKIKEAVTSAISRT